MTQKPAEAHKVAGGLLVGVQGLGTAKVFTEGATM